MKDRVGKLKTVEDHKKDINYHERRVKSAKQRRDKAGEAIAYCDLGKAHFDCADFKRAVVCYEKSLIIGKQSEDSEAEAGNFKLTSIRFDESQDKVVLEAKQRFREDNVYCRLGIAHGKLGNIKTAIDYHERHLKIAKNLDDRLEEGIAYVSLSDIHRNMGNLKTAVDYNESALKIFQELPDRPLEKKTYESLGNVHLRLGNFEIAMEYYQRALKMSKELGDTEADMSLYQRIGNIYYRMGNFEVAKEYFEVFERYVGFSKNLDDLALAYESLGAVYFSLRKFQTALEYFERQLGISMELGEKAREGSAYDHLGRVYYEWGNYQTAIDYLQRSLAIWKELGDKLGEGDSSAKLGQCFESLGEVQEALKYYRLSVNLLNDVRNRLQYKDDWKITLRDQHTTSYTRLWRLLLKQGKVEEALLCAEQGRAQGLKDLMAVNYSFETNYVGSSIDKRTFNEMFSDLPANTIFLATGNNEFIFWVCQKGKVNELRRKEISSPDIVQQAYQEIGPTDNLNCEDRSLQLARSEKLPSKKSSWENRRSQFFTDGKSALRKLYDLVIGPISDLFIDSDLVFVPEGALFLAPFAALKDPNSKYLCESYKIRVAPSLTTLKMIAECPDDYHCKSDALLVGDPWVQDVNKLPPLPFAREEVEMIGRLLGSTPLIGRQATKDEVLQRIGSVALVHIAAHGSMETGEIALAPNPGETDFIMTMKDVLRAKIRARLVVLSCCHSAHGKIKAEGVVGIARAFLGAGARSVLVSLWAIDDKATLEFMKNFYQHLVEGKSASKALNQAMNCMRESEEFSVVKHWAPLVLIGDDVTLEFGGSE